MTVSTLLSIVAFTSSTFAFSGSRKRRRNFPSERSIRCHLSLFWSSSFLCYPLIYKIQPSSTSIWPPVFSNPPWLKGKSLALNSNQSAINNDSNKTSLNSKQETWWIPGRSALKMCASEVSFQSNYGVCYGCCIIPWKVFNITYNMHLALANLESDAPTSDTICISLGIVDKEWPSTGLSLNGAIFIYCRDPSTHIS